MNYTPEQHEAVYTHDRNLIVTAGAGSGKTRVLVDRFIAMLEANPDWPLTSLVAITFTEKAAREMRDRVRQTIERRIAEATESGDEAAIRRWRDHQAALDGARIGTIHSLCTTILRANAAEVGIDPAFEVLDEIEALILRTEAIEEALTNLADENPRAARLLTEYDVNTVKRALSQWIALRDDQLDQLSNQVEYYSWWKELYDKTVSSALERLRQDAELVGAVCWEPASGWPSSDKLMANWDMILADRDRVLAPSTPVSDIFAILERWRHAIKLTGGTVAAWGGKDGLDTAKNLLKVIRARAEAVCAEVGDLGETDQLAADLLPLWGEALTAVRQAYRALKGSRLLDFDDLEALTRKLLRDSAVAERYRGTEFRHILVDEFQDTNQAQRDIVEALAGFERPGSLFVVGDPRQSIYQFRGADVSVFGQVQKNILANGGREIALSTSFRTHRRLVDAFNAIFARLMTRGSGPNAMFEVELGQPMSAIRDSDSPLCLEMILIDKDKTTNSGAEELRRWEASTLAQRLSEMVEQGWQTWDKHSRATRPLTFGDMAILFQSSRGMPLVEEAFKAASIPYVTVGGKGYYSRSEVWDLLNLLKALYNPADDLSLASALRSPLYNLSDDDLFALRLQTTPTEDGESWRLSLWHALADGARVGDPPLPDPQQVAFARDSLRRLRGIAGRVPISELLVRALDETAYLATLSGLPDGARRCGNVEKLIEVARRSGRIALGEFTLYLDDLTQREVREGEALVAAQGAVQLMTVHASKGLEFPVVALFDTSWDGGTHDATLMFDPVIGPACMVRDSNGEKVEPFAFRLAKRYAEEREAAERTRLLYVAMTRAQDYVIVGGRMNGKGPWLRQLVETLGVPLTIESESETEVVRLDWGNCLVRIPTRQPRADSPQDRAERPESESGGGKITAWDQLQSQPVPGVEAHQPPLLAMPPVDYHAPARLLTTNEIGILGEAKANNQPGLFRYHVLRDAPTTIYRVAGGGTGVSGRIVGEMVHRALRWGHLPSSTATLRSILDSYAWEEGLTDPQMIEEAIAEATRLLARSEENTIISQMQQSSQVFRELPFTLKFGERTISGVIDSLFFSKFQRWNVLDYKTSAVGTQPGSTLPERIRDHAARYHAQIGLYAQAVEAMTGQTPDAHVYYVRYAYAVHVEEATWKAALDALDGDIDAALDE